MRNITDADEGFWIGLTDRQAEGTFVWESGRLLGYRLATKWEPGNPDNWNGTENCVMITKSYNNVMNDVMCDRKSTFFCQKRSGAD